MLLLTNEQGELLIPEEEREKRIDLTQETIFSIGIKKKLVYFILELCLRIFIETIDIIIKIKTSASLRMATANK